METTTTNPTTYFAVIVKGYAHAINAHACDVVFYTARDADKARRLFDRLPNVLSWTDCGTDRRAALARANELADAEGFERPWKFDSDNDGRLVSI